MKCYATGYDFKAHFGEIRIPMAVFFGDLDKIASAHSTCGICHAAKSEYLLWRPVKENSHLELTMGSDIHQICEEVRDLIEYAALCLRDVGARQEPDVGARREPDVGARREPDEGAKREPDEGARRPPGEGPRQQPDRHCGERRSRPFE